jgi:DNA-binding NarL/FixJ family response regulator
MRTEKIRVLLVDDEVLFVECLQTVLERRSKDIEVVGIVYDGADVLDTVRLKKPDIVLMDIRMPNVDGVDATRMILEEFPDTHIMILTSYDKNEYVWQTLQLGAVGYILKDVHPSYLINAVNSVYKGGVLISPQIAKKLVMNSSDEPGDETQHMVSTLRKSVLSELSVRETEVLYHISRGYSNREIADKLFIAEQTVKNHVSVIYAKLGLRDRMQALLLAKEVGLNDQSYI